jgi:PAS domain S-box-containing protein
MKSMVNIFYSFRARRRIVIAFFGGLVPLNTLAQENPTTVLNHLGSDIVIIAILLSNTLLLVGFLIRLHQMRSDVTRKTTALEKSERHIRLMGDNLPKVTIFQLTYSQSTGFSFNYLSKGYERVLNIDRDRVMEDAKLAFDHIYETDIPILKEAYQQAVDRLSPVDFEVRVLDLEGNLKWLHISAVPHREKDMLVWDGFMQDVSDSKNIEDALVEEKRNFQNLFDTIDDFLIVCDMNGNLLHANPSVERRLGYRKEELETMSIFELYPEDIRDEAYQVIAIMQSEESTTCGLPLKMKRGSTIPVDMNIFQGSWKNRKAIFGVARDIAGRQQTETALRESQQMLQLIMNTIPMSVFWKDQDSVYLGCNQTFIQACGLNHINEVVGKTPFDLFNLETATGLIARDQQVISTNRPLLNNLNSHTRSDGNTGWRETSKIPLQNDEGNAVGILGVWRDVTKQRNAEERLKRTLDDMERFNQLMRGRERRTLELKAEVNDLLLDLGLQTKYKTITDKSA